MKKTLPISTVSTHPGGPAGYSIQWDMALSTARSFFNLRHRSLPRSIFLVIGSLFAAVRLAGFPEAHATPKLLIPTLVAGLGTWDTMRCLQQRWSFYHGAVLILIYMDMMALSIILFLLLYPYGRWLL